MQSANDQNPSKSNSDDAPRLLSEISVKPSAIERTVLTPNRIAACGTL